MAEHHIKIDESLYSRQLYALGVAAMRRMATASVLIIGVGGLGAEIAKNVILSGVKQVTLFDPAPAAAADLASQFFLTEEHVARGTPRAEASLPAMRDLNPYVKTCVAGEPLSDALLSRHDIVVVADLSADTERVASLCRARGIKLVLAAALGVAGRIFCDFGEEFVVSDPDGEEPKRVAVRAASLDRVDDTHRLFFISDGAHDLSDGDQVTVSDIRAAGSVAAIVNSDKLRRVRVTSRDTFELLLGADERAALSEWTFEYTRGGFVQQVKPPVTVDFMSYAAARGAPKFPEFVFDAAAQLQLHRCFEYLQDARARGERLPRPWNEGDARQFAEAVGLPGNEAAMNFARTCAGVISPTCALVGGWAAQEVLKAASGKYMPLRQFFYYEDFRALPESGALRPSELSAAPRGSRYDGNIMVFGAAFQEHLHGLSALLVGAGALGCEFLKQYALMGVATAPGAALTVTDNDLIERSNLSRQFLFRNTDVGLLKSEIAAARAARMNPAVNLRALALLVAPETEDQLDDAFWNKQDLVCNAVDNVHARLYVDERCVFFGKPLLESGTLGPKANSQVIIPHLTESYGSSRDPEETTFHSCTIHNLPYTIQHTIVWAKDVFCELFERIPADVNEYLTAPEEFVQALREEGANAAQRVVDILSMLEALPRAWGDCLIWARKLFQQYFTDRIRRFLERFPLDHREASGEVFWSGTKRPPTAAEFDTRDQLHLDFVFSAARILAGVFGIRVPPRGVSEGVELLRSYTPPPMAARGDELPDLEEMLARLPSAQALGDVRRLEPAAFEKDDDLNGHVDFITAASNLRARNYDIAPATRAATKLIAGRIVPAMITTTALIVGLVGLEACKVADWLCRPDGATGSVTRFANSFVNLALPLAVWSDPIACRVARIPGLPRDVTLWDFLDVRIADLPENSVGALVAHLRERYAMDPLVVTCGKAIVWQSFGDSPEHGAVTIEEAIERATKEPFDRARAVVPLLVVADPVNAAPDAAEEFEYPPLRLWRN